MVPFGIIFGRVMVNVSPALDEEPSGLAEPAFRSSKIVLSASFESWLHEVTAKEIMDR